MSAPAKSRWADSEQDAAFEARKKQEKEERRRLKAERQRKLEDTERARHAQPNGAPLRGAPPHNETEEAEQHPAKRRKLGDDSGEKDADQSASYELLRFPAPQWGPCRHVDNFEKLNHIEEGSYGWVSRARETATSEIVALKKLKIPTDSSDLPVTGMREIQTLMVARHENIVALREVVVGDGASE